ncbi:Anucleate primary sterigmata protein B [Ascosphaera acerosa]|nr:Anucleate primary sterigmata protein B [Ascosphaera acerosa]
MERVNGKTQQQQQQQQQQKQQEKQRQQENKQAAHPVPLVNVTNVTQGADEQAQPSTSPDFSPRKPLESPARQAPQARDRLSASPALTDATSAGDMSGSPDYALRSANGTLLSGSTPRLHKRSRSRNDMSRTASFGSIASSISAFSDDQPVPSLRGDLTAMSDASFINLQTVDEDEQRGTESPRAEHDSDDAADVDVDEEPLRLDTSAAPSKQTDTARKNLSSPSPAPKGPITPNGNTSTLQSITTLTSRVKGLALSPHVSAAKRDTKDTGFPRTGKALTLKEQSSTIDRLSKENFDLKMRIHFLSEALDRRSEEGIKEMISENVELNSAKLKLQKDNQALRRKVKELEETLKEKESGKSQEAVASQEREQDEEEGDKGQEDEELLYLRERVETYEIEIERMRSESIVRESERRRLAGLVKALGSEKGGKGSDAGTREEREMWKDVLGSEAAARDKAEEENRRLHYEIARLKGEPVSARASRVGTQSVLSHSTIVDRDFARSTRNGRSTATPDRSTLAEIDLLRQENAELRREVSAQTSMLTSRNREKERLYQEIEELKLHQRRDDSATMLSRSLSRVDHDRAISRSSGEQPKSDQQVATLSEAERESLETKNEELRDQVSALKLENQNIRAQLEDIMAQMESYEQAYQADMQAAEEEIQAVAQERDEAFASIQEQDTALHELRNEAQSEIDALGDELEEKYLDCERMETELRNQQENLEALQAEIRAANEGISRLEEDSQANLQKYKNVQAELNDANQELDSMGKSLYEANRKIETMTVQQESSQNEIAFLREEQEGDKIRIGDLEAELKTCQIDHQSERDRARELEIRLIEEREQREAIDNQEKKEVQRTMNELNREMSTAKDEIRKLKKSLSAAQLEANTWKERLLELEQSLRETLGDLTGSRTSLLMSITKIQRELEQTALELESTRTALDEKETLLRNRNALLESHALETKKLAELLDRERQAHRADKHSFDQALKSHQQASRTISQNTSRISDLENARSQERRHFAHMEQQYKDQLSERNAMFLTIWKRLSSLCGPDWAHSNSLINGNLPSQEVIGNMLFWPGFSKNLLLSVKTVESVFSNFKTQIKALDRELTKQYQTLEHNLGLRFKKLDRLEEMATSIKIQVNQQQNHKSRASVPAASAAAASHETKQLKSEIKLLKAELNLSESRNKRRTGIPGHASRMSVSSAAGQRSDAPSGANTGHATPEPMQGLNALALTPSRRGSSALSPDPNQRWIERLHELERKIKVEREARLLDREGARRRLLENNATMDELQAQLDKHKAQQQAFNPVTYRRPHRDTEDRAEMTASRASHMRSEDAVSPHRDGRQSAAARSHRDGRQSRAQRSGTYSYDGAYDGA